MKPKLDAALRSFQRSPLLKSFKGRRVKDLRHQVLRPGGRAELSLFERAPGDERPHPRLRLRLPPAADPAPPAALVPPEAPPTDAAAFEAWLREAWAAQGPRLARAGSGESRQFRAHSVWGQRAARFFEQAEALRASWEREGRLREGEAARYALAVLRDEVLIGEHPFDDEDTGTYHSFGKDQPFVHYLEAILSSLPAEGSEGMALLDAGQQEAVRRQRQQATAHLDALMRHKYAYAGIVETDIERSLGGFLIDRRTRHIVSEDPASADSLRPAYQLLRIDPAAEHPRAGAWVYRDGAALRGQDGEPVQARPEQLRATPIPAEQLSFRRAPRDPRLRAGIRFDWDGSGFVRPGAIDWIGWAGHCDIKAIMEQLGLALLDGPTLTEYRSDTDTTTVYDRKLLIEMLASVLELGSVHARLDGSGDIVRGEHHFGGARNDSRPDRLQFQGPGPGRSFRWPLGGRQESFRVLSIERDGQRLDPGRAFASCLPAEDGRRIVDNPHYLGTVEGDYNLIRADGAVLRVAVEEERFDPDTGYPVQARRELDLDLRAEAGGRTWLGSAVKDGGARELYQVWLDRTDPSAPRIEARLERWEKGQRGFAAVPQPQGDVILPLIAPLRVTLSRELRRDDPAVFQALLEKALRQGQNICADTDMQAEVWNGVVTHLSVQRLAAHRDTRTERWRIDLRARFGEAVLDYLLERHPDGRPARYCPMPTEDDDAAAPDFLWQDLPDVASKGLEGSDWVVNRSMMERGIVELRNQTGAQGEVYVHDEHIKGVFEQLYCALGGLPYTIVHGNKRYGFAREEDWRPMVARLQRLRARLEFQG